MSDVPLPLSALAWLMSPTSCTNSCFDITHTWTPSCFMGSWDVFLSVMITSITRIYPPIYLIGALLRKESMDYFKFRFFRDILQSSLAIAVNGSGVLAGVCVFRKLFGRFYYLSMIFLPGLIASFLGISVERRERQGVLCLYMCNQAADMIYQKLKAMGYISPVWCGEVWLFSITTAIMMYLYRSRTGMKKGVLRSLIGYFIGSSNPEEILAKKTEKPWLFFNRSEYKMSLSCIKQSLKAFITGYILQVLPSIPKLIKRPGLLLKVLWNSENFNCGLFLGSYVAIYKSVEYALTYLRKTHDEYNAAIAGCLSGLSMFFYRSSTVATYLAFKVIETAYKHGKAQGLLPSLPHATVLLYSVSTAMVFHGLTFEAQHVRRSYWKYLNTITGDRFCEINRYRLGEVFGTDSVKLFPAK
ncbi:transmembrane protein 135 isoform X2 [Nematostella vectensis]|uniref:transmembrane protein 135 isoform X2 n=1 Tax=Nematostella vectensis TaxID=45351 RepID=UPI0020774F66|nr:transmembrane protein 135 isoform X2 [Nematostella vectensis]